MMQSGIERADSDANTHLRHTLISYNNIVLEVVFISNNEKQASMPW